ncbi:MAG: hypothetical protein ABI675_21040 [Chitinophagaceae bacterium]
MRRLKVGVTLKMAMIFLGKSKCNLCGQTLMEGQKIISLPPSVDTSNQLYQYFDAGFHQSCFEVWDKKEQIESMLAEEKKNFENSDYYKEILSKHGKP